jgi:hypothetical protein
MRCSILVHAPVDVCRRASHGSEAEVSSSRCPCCVVASNAGVYCPSSGQQRPVRGRSVQNAGRTPRRDRNFEGAAGEADATSHHRSAFGVGEEPLALQRADRRPAPLGPPRRAVWQTIRPPLLPTAFAVCRLPLATGSSPCSPSVGCHVATDSLTCSPPAGCHVAPAPRCSRSHRGGPSARRLRRSDRAN